MLPTHPTMYTQSPHVVPPAASNQLRYMLNLLGDVEPALHTPHMRPKGIQDEFCEAPTELISGPSMRVMEQAGWTLGKKGELPNTPLSKETMKKVDSTLAQLSKSVNTVRSIQLAIETAQLILPAFGNRLKRVKRWLDADIQRLSRYKAKCMEEGTTSICDVAWDTVQLANAELRYIMYECSSALVTNNDEAVITAGPSPDAIMNKVSSAEA